MDNRIFDIHVAWNRGNGKQFSNILAVLISFIRFFLRLGLLECAEGSHLQGKRILPFLITERNFLIEKLININFSFL